MELNYFINLILLFAVNVLFFFSGVCLNSLVILSFWKSAQLRKKLCYFMILVLSSCDLLAVLTNHPLTSLMAMLWLTGRLDKYPNWVVIFSKSSNFLLGGSLLALLVMNVDRYLATSYPFFHRTSVTKGRLLTLFALLIIFEVTLTLVAVNELVIPYELFILICLLLVFPPVLFINYKLLAIASRSRRGCSTSPQMEEKFSFKNIPTCLLAVVCFVVLLIPLFTYLGIRLTSRSKHSALTFDGDQLAGLWSRTIMSMNSTFNCLIFYWKNKILRSQGVKIIKEMKFC